MLQDASMLRPTMLDAADHRARPQADRHGVQVIARAALLLRALDSEPRGLSLSQLADKVGLPRSTVQRIVSALADEGFVTPASPTGRVRLGHELARLAAAGRRDVWLELHPLLQTLFDKLNETVDCAVVDGLELRLVDQIPAPHRLRAVSAVGATFPLHCNANGKAVLAAWQPEDVVRLLPARLQRFTDNTITSRTQLVKELATVRETGIAFDLEEHTIGICAAGTTVRDPFGTLVAISVPVPTQRFNGRKAEIAQALIEFKRDHADMFGFPAG
jgi:DNA-binding IclR family transcriptional regulator